MPVNNYMQKKLIKGGKNRKPPVSRRRHNRFRRPIIVIVAIVIIAAVIFALSKFGVFSGFKANGEGDDEPSSETASMLPVEGESSGETSSADTSSKAGENQNLDDLTPAKEREVSSDIEALNTMMIVGNSGYRYYKFSEKNSQTYIDTVTAAAKQLSGKATVYDIVCPTSTDIMLPQIFLVDKQTSDQQKAIDYIAASINVIEPSVKTVKLYEILKAHCDEDIYFRTDRNWTALGAYYAYYQFAVEKGFVPISLNDWTKVEFEGFRGTMFSQSQENSRLEEKETLVAYKPPYETAVTTINSSGETSESSIIVDVGEYDSDKKYCAFLGGDYTQVVVNNKTITDGSACVVIEETMGTAMVPFLSAHYQTVYVLDYRYWKNNLAGFVTEKAATDVIFINSIEHTSDEEANAELKALIS